MRAMSSLDPTRPADPGVTLIELLVVLALIAVLTSLVYPGYRESMQRARRIDARSGLQAIQLAQSRFHGRTGRFAKSLADLGIGTRSDEGYYTFSLEPVADATKGFIAHAHPVAGGPQSGDACDDLRIDASGPVIDDATAEGCWP